MSSVPKQQKAAILTKEKTDFEVQDWPIYSPKEDEVLIKITATSINPVDWKCRDWGIFVEKYPAILGSDASGEIVDIGKNVKEFTVGERVFFQGIIGTIESATFQQFCLMPKDLLGKIPSSIQDDQAANIGLASMAVIVGFYNETGAFIQPAPWQPNGNQAGKGKSIVILGGSSSVGQYAIQFARLSGFETIVTGSSIAHHEHLKELGATVVLDRSKAKPEDYAKAATRNGHSFALIYDSIASTETQIEAVQILQSANKKGTNVASGFGNLKSSALVTVYNAEDPVKEEIKKGIENGSDEVEIKVVWGIGSKDFLRPQASAFLQAVGGEDGWLAKKQFFPNRTTAVHGGIAAINEACNKNREGVSGQKIVVHPFE